MEILLEYKLSHRYSHRHYQLTQRMGYLPLGVALILFYAHGRTSGPGLWMGLGVSLALQLMLWSGYALHFTRERRSRLGDRLVSRTDLWFPNFLIAMQGGFTAVSLLMFWFTLLELGYRSITAQFVLLAGLLALMPMRRIYRLRTAEQNTVANEIIYYFLYYLNWSLIALFLATTFHAFALPDDALSSDSPFGALFIWIPAVLAVIACMVLFVDHVVRKLPAVSPAGKEKDALD